MISFLNLKNLKTVNWRDHNMAGAQAVHVALMVKQAVTRMLWDQWGAEEPVLFHLTQHPDTVV